MILNWNSRIRSQRYCHIAVFLLAALLGGHVYGASSPTNPINLAATFAISAQWRYPAVPGAGYDTVEVFLENTGSRPVTFTSVSWNGADVASQTDAITWWQFYPSATVGPRETIALQINFKSPPTRSQSFALTTEDGQTATCNVPPFETPHERITGISYTLDYRRVFVQYHPKSLHLDGVIINGHPIRKLNLMKSECCDDPDMIAFDAPFPITAGMPICIELRVLDGAARKSIVRAMSGILLDAYGVKTREQRQELGLDADPVVAVLDGGDVACGDTTKKKHGSCAADIVAQRKGFFSKAPNKLGAIHYCTASFNELWNLYGGISDTAFVNPYALGYFHNPTQFIEVEEAHLKAGWKSVRPRPFMWIPEAFKSKHRFLEADELAVLGWLALVRGCKGIKYYTYGGKDGFDGEPALRDGIRQLNRTIREKMEILSPLLLVSEEVIGEKKTGFKVYEAWAGDAGILLMVRNLDYETDPAGARRPAFHVNSKREMVLERRLPEWLNGENAKDFLTGADVPVEQAETGIRIHLGEVGAFRLVWLKNISKSTL